MDITTNREQLTQFIVECFLGNHWTQLSLFGQKQFTFVKTFKTFVGNREASISPMFFSEYYDNLVGFNGEFVSAGENALSVLSHYITIGMDNELIASTIKQLAKDCDFRISKSFSVKLLRFNFKTSGAFLCVPYKSLSFDRKLMGKKFNKVEFCTCCECEHSKVF